MSKSRFVTASLTVFALFASLTISPGRAQTAVLEAVPSHPALTSRFTFELGGFYSRSSTQASLGPSGGGTGVIVDFENTLGLDERNLSAIGGFLWRMSDRWRLEVDYFSLNRDATRTLATDLDWGDLPTIPAGQTVTSSYDFSDIRVSAGYSFFKRRDKELGVGIGLHVAGIETSIQTAGFGSESSDVLAPLPVLNLYGTFALTNEWAVRFRMDWLSLNYDIYSGDLRNTTIDVLYQPFRNIGFGLGLRSLILDVEIDDPEWHGKARTVFTGPAAFMRVSF
ncbi:MAG TPA: hypothetical protein VLC73_08625 [Burkholderiales bacterium]|nr:hypothetical protein [Burkholderiales bacterium]